MKIGGLWPETQTKSLILWIFELNDSKEDWKAVDGKDSECVRSAFIDILDDPTDRAEL